MIELTADAIHHLKALLASKQAEPGTGLRLQIEKGGCAGLQYAMRLDQAATGDSVFEDGGVSLIVDAESLAMLTGSKLDYVEDLSDSGFRVVNPHAARSCGCGTSFEPKAD
jgi:iron-sulfur cluster assembly protein